jgi:hypothetical protein
MAQAPIYNPEIPDSDSGLDLDGFLIQGAGSGLSDNFNSANFGDGDVGTNKIVGNVEQVLDNIFVTVGNKITEGTHNYAELNRTLNIINSTFYKNKLKFFLRDEFLDITSSKFDKVLELIGSDRFNTSSRDLIKTFDIPTCSLDTEIAQDIDEYFSRVVSEYDKVVTELLKADSTLNNKLLAFESMSKSLDALRTLEKNDASDKVQLSIVGYMKEFYINNSIEDSFKLLINAYSRFVKYRSFMKVKLAADGEENEHRLPLCSVCISNQVSWAFVPCGHTFCGNCAGRQVRICYICRVGINSKLKLYFS